MTLTKYEKETIILFNEGEEDVYKRQILNRLPLSWETLNRKTPHN